MLELRELKPRFTLLGGCTSCPVLSSDLKASAVEIKNLKHKLYHSSCYIILSPPCVVCGSLKGKLFDPTKESTELKIEVAYLTARLEKIVLSEKMIEEDLSRVEESVTKSTYKLSVEFERCKIKGEKSAPKFVPSSNYHTVEEALKLSKIHYSSNPKPSFKPKRDVKKKIPSLEMKLLFICFVTVLVTWMSFAFVARELRRCALTMLETHIMMTSLKLCLVLTLTLHLTLLLVLCLVSHEPNHGSYGFGSRENSFVPRRFGYDYHPHRGDRFSRRSGFPTGGSHTHFELRHLNGACFSRHGSCPTHPNGEVQRTVKTSSGHMVKCRIPKIYLTNSSTESSTFSHPM
jgi:hypothetical protein